MVTGEGEIREVVGTAVLLRDDVLDMERKERVSRLGKAAVLATVSRSGADSPPGGCADHEAGCSARSLRAFA